MEVEFPETFQHVLDYMNWLKGDIITYFNVKCWAPSLDLYSEFVIAMAIIPGALSIGIIAELLQRYMNQRRLKAAALKQDSQDSVPDSGLSESLSGAVHEESASNTKPARTGQSDWESMLNKMFILTFLVCELRLLTFKLHRSNCVRAQIHSSPCASATCSAAASSTPRVPAHSASMPLNDGTATTTASTVTMQVIDSGKTSRGSCSSHIRWAFRRSLCGSSTRTQAGSRTTHH